MSEECKSEGWMVIATGTAGEMLNGMFVVMADLDVVVEGTPYVSVEG